MLYIYIYILLLDTYLTRNTLIEPYTKMNTFFSGQSESIFLSPSPMSLPSAELPPSHLLQNAVLICTHKEIISAGRKRDSSTLAREICIKDDKLGLKMTARIKS